MLFVHSSDSIDADFVVFWAHYPRKVGKLGALKAYRKARRLATASEILDGVERYTRTKPAYADWCHPATFLNAGRWMDEVDEPRVTRSLVDHVCPHDPKCHSTSHCLQFRDGVDRLKAERKAAS